MNTAPRLLAHFFVSCHIISKACAWSHIKHNSSQQKQRLPPLCNKYTAFHLCRSRQRTASCKNERAGEEARSHSYVEETVQHVMTSVLSDMLQRCKSPRAEAAVNVPLMAKLESTGFLVTQTLHVLFFTTWQPACVYDLTQQNCLINQLLTVLPWYDKHRVTFSRYCTAYVSISRNCTHNNT